MQYTPGAAKSLALLLVGCDDFRLSMTAGRLRESGHHVITFADLQVAILAFREESLHFDLALVDTADMGPLEARRLESELRTSRPRVPIVRISTPASDAAMVGTPRCP